MLISFTLLFKGWSSLRCVFQVSHFHCIYNHTCSGHRSLVVDVGVEPVRPDVLCGLGISFSMILKQNIAYQCSIWLIVTTLHPYALPFLASPSYLHEGIVLGCLIDALVSKLAPPPIIRHSKCPKFYTT